MSRLEIVKTYPYSDAFDFLGAFALTRRDYRRPVLDEDTYIYRGQASCAWRLIPPALRKGTRLYKDKEWVEAPLGTNKVQIWAEFQTLCKFFEIGDREGLRMPDDGQILRSALLEVEASLIDEKKIFWPPRTLLSLLALAQHSRLPTRLVDWSSDPYVAAYFAAHDGICRPAPRGARIAVYRLSTALLEKEKESQAGWSEENISLRLSTAPQADNVKLHAQGAGLHITSGHLIARFLLARNPSVFQ